MSPPALRLGVNTCFASKHWPAPEHWLPVVASWGIDAVQFSFDQIDPLQFAALELAAEVGASCRAARVHVLSSFTGGRAYATNMLLHPDPRQREWSRQWFLAAVQLTAALEAPATGGFVGALPAQLVGHPAGAHLVDELVRFGEPLGRAAAAAGLDHLLVELMPGQGEVPNTAAGARRLLERLNAASPVPYLLCYDLGHACGPGADDDTLGGAERIYTWLAKLLDVTRCVHLQQTDGAGDHHWPFVREHDADGAVEPGRVLGILAASPLPAVDLILELAHPPEAPAQQIRHDWAASVAVWRDAMSAAPGRQP